MRRSRVLSSVLLTALALGGSSAVAVPTRADHIPAADCFDQLAWTDHVPQAPANGATMAWRYQTLFSDKWSDGGFAAEVMWVGTDGALSDDLWVEAGITHGWQGQNIRRFYSARNNVANGYDEALLSVTATPSVGTGYGFEVWAVSTSGSGTYRAIVNNTLGSQNWDGHLPNTVQYSGGFESRGFRPDFGFDGCRGQVNATAIYRNRYRAKSDGIYRDVNNGTRTDASDQGTNSWCTQPIYSRYWMHSTISGNVC